MECGRALTQTFQWGSERALPDGAGDPAEGGPRPLLSRHAAPATAPTGRGHQPPGAGRPPRRLSGFLSHRARRSLSTGGQAERGHRPLPRGPPPQAPVVGRLPLPRHRFGMRGAYRRSRCGVSQPSPPRPVHQGILVHVVWEPGEGRTRGRSAPRVAEGSGSEPPTRPIRLVWLRGAVPVRRSEGGVQPRPPRHAGPLRGAPTRTSPRE